MNDWRAGAGAGLFHCPDVVVLGMDAPGVWTCIEVKTFDVTATSHMDAHRTHRVRLAAHLAAIRDSRRDEYRVDGPHAAPLAPVLGSPVCLAPVPVRDGVAGLVAAALFGE